MEKARFLALMVGMVFVLQAGVMGSVLFSDTYDRTDNTDIDVSTDGMSGSLAPMVYQEVFEGSGVNTSIQVIGNQLNVARGVGMSSLFLDHNFTDAAITSSGGFSISMDVVSITTADDAGNRYGGFGVGNTLAEAMAAKDSFDSAVPYRPNLARANTGIGVSDFFVDLALDKNLRVWSNGNLLSTINVGAAAGTISVDFLTSGFDAAGTVNAIIYFNGVQVDTKSFAWDNTGANYIGIAGRTAAAGVFLDNLEIAVIPEPATLILLGLGGLLLRRNK
jgi:hypothetical protein